MGRVLFACVSLFFGTVDATMLRSQGANNKAAISAQEDVCGGAPCVMQNMLSQVCYEGSEHYLRRCVRGGVSANRISPDLAFVFSKSSEGTCEELGYPTSLHEVSSVVYEGVEARTSPAMYAFMKPMLDDLVQHPEAITLEAGYPANCTYFGKTVQ
mmetsp:Transcript_121408/g.259230  ORF Transcript_121408/g.259230 Transcript_121408/m.259230 type:complete len:156 (-) Transcript_121408:91-558(-)